MKKIILALGLIVMPTITVLAGNVNSQANLTLFEVPIITSQESLSKLPNHGSYTNSIFSVTDKECVMPWCRKFTVQVNIGVVSVATDVVMCAANNGYGGLNIWIQNKNGGSSTLADITDTIKELQVKSNQKDIKEVEITASDVQSFEEAGKYVIEKGTYTVGEKDGSYYISPNFVKN